MNTQVRHVSFRRLGTSEIHLRYLEDDPQLAALMGERPRDAASLLRAAPSNARRLVEPDALAGSLAAYAERHGAPQPVFDSIAEIGSGDAFVVVTGQQPGLLGGPLYTVHKAATAVRLARELSKQPGAPRVVPVFWNHTDDHDLDEVNRAFVINANLDVQRFRIEQLVGGEPIREIPVGRHVDSVLASVRDLLPASDFRDWAFDLFTPRHADEHFGDGLARLLFGMFGDAGLVVIEPRDLPQQAFDVLPRWFAAADDVRSRVRSVTEHLSDIGFDVTLDPTTTMMFQCSGGRRQALSDGEPVHRAGDLSPGVLLRPLWQDAILPNVGFVVGPGELSYLAVVAPLYKMLGVPRPAFVPRASLTLVERSLVKLLKRFGWDLPDLLRGPEELVRTLGAGEDEQPEDALAALADRVAADLDTLRTRIHDTDNDMVRPIDKTRTKVVDELQKLQQRLRNARQNREGTGLRQIRRLCANLRPRGRAQERVLGILPYLVSHGAEFADVLIDAADPFSVHHGVLEL